MAKFASLRVMWTGLVAATVAVLLSSQWFVQVSNAQSILNRLGFRKLAVAASTASSVSSSSSSSSSSDTIVGRQCIDGKGGDCELGFDRFLEEDHDFHHALPEQQKAEDDEKDEEDPMLKLMPGTGFKAYVRADVSTFYGEEPGSRQERTPAFNGQAGKFINMSPDPVSLFWEGPNGLSPISYRVGPFHAGGTACFPGHKFVFTKHNDQDHILCRMKVVPGVSVYFCDPFRTNDLRNKGQGIHLSSKVRSLDTLSERELELYDAHVYNLEFGKMYKKFTNGTEWLTMYPKDPPMHKMWRADYFGQKHTIVTRETQFHTLPDDLTSINRRQLRRESNSSMIAHPELRQPGEMNITVRAASCAPRVFEVPNFLSDLEADHIIQLAEAHQLERSTTNGHVSSTRTSRTTWLKRESDIVLDSIFRRVADTLRLDEALLRQRSPGEIPDRPNTQQLNEDLQIVHYALGQEYTAHHDFGYPTSDTNSRSINFCMYLKSVEEGGETAFPRWRNAHTNEAIKVKPEKGKAVIFYNVMPDGNLDDLAQHAAMPVITGEKYFSNLWIWDKERR